ncbi:MAG: glycoside hydrolase family 3 C-terminal domain-containing protein [Lachnospiraceae bacterium]|nr:glycoside hydrolase family 3 C-terminal domain-containing protein [Lachnospiraceae bacterium]
MKKMILDFDKYCDTARRTVAEGQVLLRNEGNVLPLPKGAKIAVFGRIQTHYYKSGTGSGGMVNVSKVTGILDALLEDETIAVNQKILQIYQKWETENPFDEGIGWGNEPWCQKEMPLTKEQVQTAAMESDYAVVIIGRTAGEDQDNFNGPGSYLLTEVEEDMLAKVRAEFAKMIVVLNVGNIMDMGFVDRYLPEAVLYAWQGGMVGGLGTADVLTGRVSPSGKLADTIAYQVTDYPSHANFGDPNLAVYAEDVYVGYRYFETVAKEKVRYPFGFGLSYTSFFINTTEFEIKDQLVKLSVSIQNTGNRPGKETVQIYAHAPQGRLGKPEQVLIGFQKTKELAPGESCTFSMEIPFETFASYDETGITGKESSYVLEAGEYVISAGSSVRDVNRAGCFVLPETLCLKVCSQALAPVKAFERMKPQRDEYGNLQMIMEPVPLRKISPAQKRDFNIPKEFEITGDVGYKLSDVKDGTISMETFIAQLEEEDLACIIRGEGMGSPKVTAGTAAAFGGVSERLKKLGIPCGCCDDGPSGMRLDSGMKAFSLPNGTLLACTFNTELIGELYAFTGIEMIKNNVEVLLGPGINIHRHPLNGRNFEYFSEDPLLTGKMAAVQIKALHGAGVTGTIKHFCANNQETSRYMVDSVVSERALREIYLKGYEIAVKEGGADSVMTTYGSVNGLWTAGSYDLNTTILRGEWNFDGIVMTDWWAMINEEGCPPDHTNFAAMTRAQNDLYMVCSQSDSEEAEDNTLASLKDGSLTVGELQRNAMNICRFLMNTQALERMNGMGIEVEVVGESGFSIGQDQEVVYYRVDREIIINLEEVNAEKGSDFVFALDLSKEGGYRVSLTAKSDLGELAQMPVTLFYQSVPNAVFTFNGTGGEWHTIDKKIILKNKYSVLRLYFAQNGLRPKEIHFCFDKPLEEIPDDDAYVKM